MTDKQIITALIDELFKKREIRNQTDFAEKVMIKQSLISQIKAGKKSITAETIERITSTFPQVNKLFLKGKSDKIFTDVNYQSEVNEPPPVYSADASTQLLKAKDQIIDLLRENSNLKTELSNCLSRLQDLQEGVR